MTSTISYNGSDWEEISRDEYLASDEECLVMGLDNNDPNDFDFNCKNKKYFKKKETFPKIFQSVLGVSFVVHATGDMNIYMNKNLVILDNPKDFTQLKEALALSDKLRGKK